MKRKSMGRAPIFGPPEPLGPPSWVGGPPAAEPPFRLDAFLPYRLSVTANRMSRAFARARIIA